LALALLSMSACEDHPLEGDSWVSDAMARPALEVVTPLPELGSMISTGDAAPFSEWLPLVDAWNATWTVGLGAGRSSRAAIYEAAFPAMAEGLTKIQVDGILTPVRDALAQVQDPATLPFHLALAMGESTRILRRAEEAAEDIRWSDAGELGLRAADALREAMPPTVAATLVEEAEKVFASSDLNRLSASDLRRATRLTRWARSALQSGDYDRAIQRAFYAGQLLGVVLP